MSHDPETDQLYDRVGRLVHNAVVFFSK